MHASALVDAAIDSEFTGHAVHAADPGAGLYVPGKQTTHVPRAFVVCPRLHVQAAALVDAAIDTELVGHTVHAADPGAALNVPGKQAPHVPSGNSENPAKHSCAAARQIP